MLERLEVASDENRNHLEVLAKNFALKLLAKVFQFVRLIDNSMAISYINHMGILFSHFTKVTKDIWQRGISQTSHICILYKVIRHHGGCRIKANTP